MLETAERDALKAELRDLISSRRMLFQPTDEEFRQMIAEQNAWGRIVRENQFTPSYFTIFQAKAFKPGFEKMVGNLGERIAKIRGSPTQIAAAEVQLRDTYHYLAALIDGVFLEKTATKSPLAHDAACRIAAAHIVTGTRMRTGLSDFTTAVLTGETKRPTHRGPHRSESQLRYLAICNMVSFCVNRGLKAMRSDADKHRNSACDLVAEALLAERLRPTTYKNVKDIWIAKSEIKLLEKFSKSPRPAG
jgi:hypothetical protein